MQMILERILKSNLFFMLIVIMLNLLFWLKGHEATTKTQTYINFMALANTSWWFFPSLVIISFLLCLFSLPGASFSLSLGGYIWGWSYLFIAGVTLFLSSWVSFPFGRKATEQVHFLKKIAQMQLMGSAVQSKAILLLLRLNPSVPFLFFAAFYKQKLDFYFLIGLFFSSTLHAVLYVAIGWNLTREHWGLLWQSIFLATLFILSLIPILLLSIKKYKVTPPSEEE